MAPCRAMICHQVTLSGDAEWPKVADAVIEAHALGLAVEQVHELLDFYHAVQRLGQVAALRKDWSAKARTRWRTQQRHLLLQGEVEQVIAAMQVLCRGRHSKAIRTHRAYFIRNRSRMASAKLMALKLPI